MNLQNQINYLRDYLDQDLFDECSVPAPLNMQRVRGAIIMRCGLLTPLYSEPEVQRAATQQFFFENQWNFAHIVKVIEAEYSPIENVAEWRDESQTGETKHIRERESGDLEQHSGTDGRQIAESGTTREAEGGKTTQAEGGTTRTAESGTTRNAESGTTSQAEGGTTAVREGGSTTTTNEISAENATTYQADNKSTVTHGKTDTTTHGRTDTTTHGKTDTITHGRTDTITHGKTDETTHGRTDTITHGKVTNDDLTHGERIQRDGTETITDTDSGDRGLTMHRHGNVGITTNTALINEELDLLERFNPYRFIADLYERELILGLY